MSWAASIIYIKSRSRWLIPKSTIDCVRNGNNSISKLPIIMPKNSCTNNFLNGHRYLNKNKKPLVADSFSSASRSVSKNKGVGSIKEVYHFAFVWFRLLPVRLHPQLSIRGNVLSQPFLNSSWVYFYHTIAGSATYTFLRVTLKITIKCIWFQWAIHGKGISFAICSNGILTPSVSNPSFSAASLIPLNETPECERLQSSLR